MTGLYTPLALLPPRHLAHPGWPRILNGTRALHIQGGGSNLTRGISDEGAHPAVSKTPKERFPEEVFRSFRLSNPTPPEILEQPTYGKEENNSPKIL